MGFYNRFLFIAKKIYSNKKIIRFLIFLLIFFILFCHNKSFAADNEFKVLSSGTVIKNLNGNTFTFSNDVYSYIEPVHYFIYKSTKNNSYNFWVIDTDDISYNDNGLIFNSTAHRQTSSINFNTNNNTCSAFFTSSVTTVSKGWYIMNYNEINNCVYSDITIYNKNGDVVFSPEPEIKYPEIATSVNDLETLNFDVLSINAWDFSNDDLYLLTYDRNSEDKESLKNLYPMKEILLNKNTKFFMKDITADEEKNVIYWVPREELGLKFKIGGTYAFRLAVREESDNQYTDWTYDYLTDLLTFTVSSDVSQATINDINNQTKDYQENKNNEELQNSINQQSQQNQQFYNNILSNDYNQNQASDTLNGMTSSSDNIDDSQYTGLFSAIFGKFSNIISSDWSKVEEIKFPVPNTNKEIIWRSDILSSKISNNFIGIFLQSFWLFLFGMYIFKFSNNLIRKIKDGTILNGYENNNEVITSSML